MSKIDFGEKKMSILNRFQIKINFNKIITHAER